MPFKHLGKLPRGVKIVRSSLKIKLHVNKSPSALPNISGSPTTTKLYYIQKKATLQPYMARKWFFFFAMLEQATSIDQLVLCPQPPNSKILWYLLSWYLSTQSPFKYSERIKTDVWVAYFVVVCLHLTNTLNHISPQYSHFWSLHWKSWG